MDNSRKASREENEKSLQYKSRQTTLLDEELAEDNCPTSKWRRGLLHYCQPIDVDQSANRKLGNVNSLTRKTYKWLKARSRN